MISGVHEDPCSPALQHSIAPDSGMTSQRYRDSIHDALAVANEFDLAVLLMLARLGRLFVRHVHMVWFTTVSRTTVWRHLQKLQAAGLIVSGRAGRWKKPAGHPGYPQHDGRLYTLTALGRTLIEDRFPLYDFDREKIVIQGQGSLLHQADHQREYADLVTNILRFLPGIPGMVGVTTMQELMLGPNPSPRCDGFLLLRRWNDAARGTLGTELPYVPWLREPKWVGQQTDKTYAVEIDRGTEAPDVIRTKAKDYFALFQSGWWRGRYRWPTPLWVVPTDRRREVVVREWLSAWPKSPLLITTQPELEQFGVDAPIWHAYFHEHKTTRSFFDDDWRQPILSYPDPAPAAGGRHGA